MKPSVTEKLLAALLFVLTVIHTTSHFNVLAQTETQSPAVPCSADNQTPGKQLQVYGQIVQIELNESVLPDSGNQIPAGEVHIALDTGVDCQIDAVVANQEWQSWSHDQQDLITIGTSVEITGELGSADGRVVLEVTQPPVLH